MPASPITDLPGPIVVVCHDAGAANLLLPLVAAAGRTDLRVHAAGPAAAIAQARVASALDDGDPAGAIAGAGTCVTGTGWASGVEHEARVAARAHRIPSIALVDHWVNYRERFVRDGVEVLPDEIWVTDEHAEDEARRRIPEVPTRRVPNLYLAEQVAGLPPPETIAQAELLYVAEPARATWGRDTPGEFQALDYFLASLPTLDLPRPLTIRLRPHPSDPPGKYDAFVRDDGPLRVVLDGSADLRGALARARWVAGCESFALVVALEAGRRVYCALPPWAPSCRLPHERLVHLKHLGPAT
ncbi:hypothetical protein [Salinarimonas rosea]|uniref:hypothetical protein n=1 Tax=Salinarimonas rosea TaxID=552063 RepID=UPI00048CBA6A|nr:hypothetical protein [Salinarimonas rosea]